MTETYIFVVDTEQYSRNFECEMCAYMTGVVGDCGVGEDEQKIFENEIEDGEMFVDIIEQRTDDDDKAASPCSIWITPGWFNDGMGGQFKDGTDENSDESLFIRGHFNDPSIPYTDYTEIGRLGITINNRVSEAVIFVFGQD